MIGLFCLFNGIDYDRFIDVLFAFFHFDLFDQGMEFIQGCNHCELPDADVIVMDEFLDTIQKITFEYIASLK